MVKIFYRKIHPIGNSWMFYKTDCQNIKSCTLYKIESIIGVPSKNELPKEYLEGNDFFYNPCPIECDDVFKEMKTEFLTECVHGKSSVIGEYKLNVDGIYTEKEFNNIIREMIKSLDILNRENIIYGINLYEIYNGMLKVCKL